MNLQKHKLAWEDFVGWYIKTYDNPDVLDDWIHFNEDTPFEMQLGVYLKYLWDKTPKEGEEVLSDYFEEMEDWNSWDLVNSGKQAIEQAFKIRNEQLKLIHKDTCTKS